MVDWDRVEQLRDRGWDWDRIADDPKVGFHPEASVQEPGRALRALYHRHRRRGGRREPEAPSRPSKQDLELREHRWTLPRVGFLAVPVFGLWGLLAYLVPSPVGLLLPAIPWLALGVAAAAFILCFGLWRTQEKRWTPTYRKTLVGGVALGLVLAGTVGLTGYLAFGCPYLPPYSTLGTIGTSGTGSGSAAVSPWAYGSMSAWQDSGKPVVYFFGAEWCPYCSAGSWAIYKALSEFGNVSGAGNALAYSDPSDVYPSTPEIVLANIGYTSSWVSFQVSEYVGSYSGHPFPGTSTCFQSAYVSAYSGGTIPFLVVNGQYVHAQSQLIYPQNLQDWAGTGASTVLSDVQGESGGPWTAVQFQAWWIMAFMAKSTGAPVSQLAASLHWSSATTSGVEADFAEIP
ncbi:MAG TPA: DUF929 family protein [Thermoplasmata archaeon]|nr:DUF929 family protein [Thermoplasmata archaeon]